MKKVTKEVPVKFSSKKEFAQALIDGRKFKPSGDYTILYDEGYSNPFRYNSNTVHGVSLAEGWIHWRSPDLKEIIEEEEVRWEDDLDKYPKGILCWVSDVSMEDIKGGGGTVDFITEYREDEEHYHYKGDVAWKYATPVAKEEVLKMCYKEEE